MKAILLAAGASSRFVDVGMSPHKCLYTVGDTSCLASTSAFLSDIGVAKHDQILVVSQSLAAHFLSHPEDASGLQNVVVTPRLQNGPALSAVLASGYIDPTDSVLVSDTDGYFPPNAEVTKWCDSRGGASLLQCAYDGPGREHLVWVPDDQVSLSYRPGVSSPRRIGTADKANLGVYHFPRFADFLRGLGEHCQNKGSTGEATLISVMHAVNKHRTTCTAGTVSSWFPCGTPDQLEYARTYAASAPTIRG